MTSLAESFPLYIPPPLDDIPDVEGDKPVDGIGLHTVGTLHLPYLVFGAGTFANQYNQDSFLYSDGPLRVVRLALRYGICAFDTAPFYGPSEIILGGALRTLRPEFPRSSYKLITKAGRYGVGFDYSPETIRASVVRSLSRLGTEYLDAVYIHDVEFVATPVTYGPTAGDHLKALEDPGSWGLAEEDTAKIRGEGDQKVLDAVGELWKLKEEGKIKAVGISGYPLPTLLRLALLVLHNPPYKPLDILLSYSHYTLQNSIFSAYLPHFRKRAKIEQLGTASPLSMGLLTPKPPVWHPVSPEIIAAKECAITSVQDWAGGLPNLALGFSLREGEQKGMSDVPRIVGLSITEEVHEAVKIWREVQSGIDENRMLKEEAVRKIFREANCEGMSWQSPSLS